MPAPRKIAKQTPAEETHDSDSRSAEVSADQRFFAIGSAAIFIFAMIVGCKLFLFLQWPLPLAVFSALIIALILAGTVIGWAY